MSGLSRKRISIARYGARRPLPTDTLAVAELPARFRHTLYKLDRATSAHANPLGYLKS